MLTVLLVLALLFILVMLGRESDNPQVSESIEVEIDDDETSFVRESVKANRLRR